MSLEVGFKKVGQRSDCLTPKLVPNTYSSTVGWLAMGGVGCQNLEQSDTFSSDELTAEMKQPAEKETTLLNTRKHLVELGAHPADRINLN